MTNWVSIGIAVVAVAIALFQERARQWWSSARVEMTIDPKPPDTHQIAMTDVTSGAFQNWAVYARVRVTHVKRLSAENVEVMVTRLWRIRDRGKQEDTSFLPLPLAWSHWTPSRSNLRVPRNLFRHCDLGAFIPDPREPGKTLFKFSTIVQPNPVGGRTLPPNIVEPGAYEFELVLAGDNTNTLPKRWHLKFEPDWSDDETTMLGRITIKPAAL